MSKKNASYRSFSPFNLSFLDVMSCGLGAVILIFLILKHGESISPNETKALEKDIENIEESIAELSNDISLKANEIISLESRILEKNKVIEEIKDDLRSEEKIRDDLLAGNENTQKVLNDIEKAIPDIINKSGEGERQYLTGLKIEGKRIVYLLDNSASMLDENTQNIFRLSILGKEQKEKTKKWMRAKETLTWLVARLPKDSQFTIMTFNEDVKSHTASSWSDSESSLEVSDALESAKKEIPEKGTNLERALVATKKMFPLPDAVYIITDGLPTLGEPPGKLNLSLTQRKCLKSKGKITSECRHVIFQKAKNNYLKGKKLKTSTILLPLQGDPRAASDYWNLALQSGGTTISPSRDWP